jgi:hypothetical protein
MSDDSNPTDSDEPSNGEEMVRNQFNSDVEALGGLVRVVGKLIELGHRGSSILRSIERMAAGDISVSDEMIVIIKLLIGARRRAEDEIAHLSWTPTQHGGFKTEKRDFTITVMPESRGRWSVGIRYKNGDRLPYPSWQPSLKEAKITAILYSETYVENGFRLSVR